jgi:hypothetical protein
MFGTVQSVGAAVDGVAGAAFGAALVSSGMVRHAKVAAFLDMLAPTRDFSLMFVMGGALALATPAIQLLLKHKNHPALKKMRSGKGLQVRDAPSLLYTRTTPSSAAL